MSRHDVVERIDESARLRALDALQVLDTPREERFDRLVALVKELFRVPVAAVTLIDEERLWAKASTGLRSNQMPRQDSVCTVTIERDEALVVPNLEIDDRFNESPTLMGSGLRFYAGQPLHAGEHRVGVLCVMGYEEREMDDAELRLLRTLADWVEAELATENEMHRAALLQRALRPRSAIRLPGFEVAGHCVTARHVGGDFYDWFMATRHAAHLRRRRHGQGHRRRTHRVVGARGAARRGTLHQHRGGVQPHRLRPRPGPRRHQHLRHRLRRLHRPDDRPGPATSTPVTASP